MACVVVAIHTHPEKSFCLWTGAERIVTIIYNMAVPFFFMASGFLLSKKVQIPLGSNSISYIKRYLSKICRMYLVWTLLFLPFTVWGFVKDEVPFLKSLLIFLRNILFVGENFYSWPLWYLLALIVAVSILYNLLLWKVRLKCIVLIALSLYAVGLIIQFFRGEGYVDCVIDLYYKVFFTTRNGFFVGLVYVVLGFQLAHVYKRLKKVFCMVSVLVGFIGTFFHWAFFDLLLLYSLFVLILQINVHFLSCKICSNLRSMSTIIYFIHMYWVAFWEALISQKADLSLWLYLLVLFSSVLTSILLLKYQDKALYKICFH